MAVTLTPEQQRRMDITQFASAYIQKHVRITRRLRLLRNGIYEGLILYLSGKEIGEQAKGELLDAMRAWPFQADVRKEALRLVRDPSKTVNDGVWPDYSTYALPTTLDPFWINGVAISRVSGLAAALESKATLAGVEARFSELVNGAGPALDTLGEIATWLQNDRSTATALTNTVAGKMDKPSGNASQYLDGAGTPKAFPPIPAAQVNADWSANSGVARILNKPTIPSAPLTLLNQTFSIGLTALNAASATNYTVPGAVVGNSAIVNPRASTPIGPMLYAWVSAANTVTVEVRALAALQATSIQIDIRVIQ